MDILNKLNLKNFSKIGLLCLILLILNTSSVPASDNSPQKNTTVNEEETLHQHSFGLGFGQILLLGDYAKKYSNNLGFSFLYDYSVNETFELVLDIGYFKAQNDNQLNQITFKNFIPNLRMNFSEYDNFTIFAMGGLGLYSVAETTGPYSGAITALGFNVGPGFDLKLNTNLKFGANVSFHNVFSKNDSNAKNPSGQGMTLGGSYSRVYLTLMYSL